MNNLKPLSLKIFDVIAVVFLAVGFVSPLFVADEYHDSTRMGAVFYGIQWLQFAIPIGIVFLWRSRELPITRIMLLMVAWLAWIVIRGKTGGIWHDEKFMWFSGCFALFFISDAILKLLKTENKSRLIIIVISVMTAVAAIEAIMGILQIYGGYRIFHGQFKVTGTFFNPAPYAIFLVASLPWSLYLSTMKRDSVWGKIAYWGGYATACLIVVIIPSTQSRAAYLATGAAVLMWLFYRYKPLLYIKTVLNTPLKRRLTFVLVPTLIIGMAVALFLLKKDSASGRLLIWKMALRSAQEQIYIGNGFNTLKATMATVQTDYFASGKGTPEEELLAGSVPWAFNEPLQMLSESGLVGLCLMLAVFGSALFYRYKTTNRDERLKIAAARGTVVAIFVFGLFSYPFYFYPIMLLLFFALAVLSAGERSLFSSQKRSHSIPLKTTVSVALGVLLVFYVEALPRLKKGYWTWDEAEKLYQIKEYKAASESYEEVLDLMQYNGLFMQQYGKCLAMNEQYPESIKVLRQSGQYYRDEFWFILLGDSYKAVADYKNAEKFYLQAANVVPHKFYPLYLLAKLYVESEQNVKAKRQARLILDKTVKVESTAIKQIKAEMEQILEQ